MTITKEQIHVITSVERRRRWSAQEKRSIIQETGLPEKNGQKNTSLQKLHKNKNRR